MTEPENYDVVVIGFGAAGAVAAITAHDAGARVLLIEKMPYPGGLSVTSAGGIRIAFDAEGAYRYLYETCGQRTPDDVLKMLAKGMVEAPVWLQQWATETKAEIRITPALGNYPFPGFETLGYVEVTSVTSSWQSNAPYYSDIGKNLFAMLYQCVVNRNITVWLNTTAEQLVRNEKEIIDTVKVHSHGKEIAVSANAGIILTTGGFEANAEMQSEYFEVGAVTPASFLGNTGDGIRMSMSVGAKQWHMWHYHGPYGYKHPDPAFPYGLYVKNFPMWTPGHHPELLPVMPWILLDQTGKRFANEYEPYPGDTGIRHFSYFDAKLHRNTRLPAYLLVDSDGFSRYPLGKLIANDPDVTFRWSQDNQQELSLGIFKCYTSLKQISEELGMPFDVLSHEIAQWNTSVLLQNDSQFGRRPETMMQIIQAPFYLAEIWPLVINTQGGPEHDAYQRVLDVSGKPIDYLYAAGELGSVFGHVYMAGGNLAECVVGGRNAANHAVSRIQRDQPGNDVGVSFINQERS